VERKLLFYLLFASFVSAYLSITVFQGFLTLAFAVWLFILLKERRFETFRGRLTVPLLGHLAVLDLSSALFLRVSEQWRRLVEQNFFTLSYFFPKVLDPEGVLKLLRWTLAAAPLLGLLLSAKVWVSFLVYGEIKAFWGGKFVIGNLLALPFFASLYFALTGEGLWRKVLFSGGAALFLWTAFLPFERSVVLGFLAGLLLFGAAAFSLLKDRRARAALLAGGLLLAAAGTAAALQNPKVEYWIKLVESRGLNAETLNALSSQRVVIAEGALELVERALEEGDYLKLLIGWGYGPQKQYENLPPPLNRIINEYESFLPITEFVNGGLLGLLFVVWFYLAAARLTRETFKRRDELFLLKVSVLSAAWVNLVYHLFTLFWVPLNALFFVLLAAVEVLNQRGREKT